MSSPDHQLGTSSVTHPERRHYSRYSAQVQIELRQDGIDVPIRMQTTDLSRGGCYVQLMMTMPIGTYLNATLWLNGCSVHVRARIVTRHPQFGNGIMFLEFQGDEEQLLTRYLAALTA
jgi:c-di-GMP-binding flagellar brake protein YcgR